jgi:hypothetical protein
MADRKKQRTLIPENWQPRAMGVSYAEQKAGWSPDRVRHETDKFKAYHEKVESKYSNWDAAWRQWVLHGLERDQQRPGPRAAALVDDPGPRAEGTRPPAALFDEVAGVLSAADTLVLAQGGAYRLREAPLPVHPKC